MENVLSTNLFINCTKLRPVYTVHFKLYENICLLRATEVSWKIFEEFQITELLLQEMRLLGLVRMDLAQIHVHVYVYSKLLLGKNHVCKYSYSK